MSESRGVGMDVPEGAYGAYAYAPGVGLGSEWRRTNIALANTPLPIQNLKKNEILPSDLLTFIC